MAQGFKLKSNNKKANVAKAKPSHQKKKDLNKGWKSFAAKGRKGVAAKQESQTTKEINRRNESEVAARAVSSGGRFKLKDLEQAGKKELGKNNRELRRREGKSAKMSERLTEQLNKLK